MRLLFMIISALLVCGCATKYQEMGFSGGVAASQMTADTYRIEARGNGYTSGTMVQDYIMLKAAETTKKSGNSHFVIINASDASTTGTIVTPGESQTSFVGNTAYTTYTPGTAHNYVKPGQDAYIRVIDVPPGTKPPLGAILAEDIIQFVGGRVKRSEPG